METGRTGDWCSGGGGLWRRESSSAVVVQCRSTKGYPRTCWCPWRGPAWPILSWPWQQPTMARTAPAARSSGGPQRRGKGVEALGGPYDLNGGPSSASNDSWCTGHVRPRQCRRRRHDGGVAACWAAREGAQEGAVRWGGYGGVVGSDGEALEQRNHAEAGTSAGPAMALVVAACRRSGEARRVRRRKELGLVTLVLHHAEGGTDTWQRGGRAASMVEARGAWPPRPCPRVVFGAKTRTSGGQRSGPFGAPIWA
jgi:hypothetical protein